MILHGNVQGHPLCQTIVVFCLNERKGWCHSWRNTSFAFWFSSMTLILKETSNRLIFKKTVYKRLCLFVGFLALVFYFLPFPDGLFWSMEGRKGRSVCNCTASCICFWSVNWSKLTTKSILKNGNMRHHLTLKWGSSKRDLKMQPYLDMMMMQLTEHSPKQNSIYFIPY